MYQLIYSSRSTRPFSDADLAALLQQSRTNNTAQTITGLLLYGGSMFVQILEGSPQAVRQLYDRIMVDPRHTDVLTVAEKMIPQRNFSDWSMAFQFVPPRALATLPSVLVADQLPEQLASLGAADAMLVNSLRRRLFTAPGA